MNQSSQSVFISSADRLSGTANDFLIRINDLQNDLSNRKLVVDELMIPYSFYPINSLNNVIQVGTTQSITITPGNYTSTQFITEITTNSPFTGTTGAFNVNTGLFSFGATGSWSITADQYNGKYLGLTTGVHNSVGNVITSDKPAILSGPLQVKVLTDLNIYSTNTRNTRKDVLVSCYPDVAFGEVIVKNSDNFFPLKMNSNKIDLQRFRIVDELDQAIDLNGLDWHLNLRLIQED